MTPRDTSQLNTYLHKELTSSTSLRLYRVLTAGPHVCEGGSTSGPKVPPTLPNNTPILGFRQLECHPSINPLGRISVPGRFLLKEVDVRPPEVLDSHPSSYLWRQDVEGLLLRGSLTLDFSPGVGYLQSVGTGHGT